MVYREVEPSPALRGLVRCYWTLESQTPLDPQLVVPDGSMELIFHLGDPFELENGAATQLQSRLLLAGQLEGPVRLRATGQVNVIGVRFLPGGAYPFLRFPLGEITGRIEELANVWRAAARELLEQLQEGVCTGRRVALVDDFLTARLADRRAPETDAAVASTIDAIVRSGGRRPVASLHRDAGLSTRQLERRFERAVGLKPKMFARVMRFQNAVRNAPQVRAADLAVECGYYDQAHMIRDFKQFCGTTPAEYLRVSHPMSDCFVYGE
ncbi:MAG: AraC family transcriptional regulator [Bryobacteraceae bacterium]